MSTATRQRTRWSDRLRMKFCHTEVRWRSMLSRFVALSHLANLGSITIAVAVCWGMLTCSFVAERMGIMSASERKAHDAVIELMGLALPEPRPSIESIMAKLMRDSKRGLVMESDDEASEVLLKEIGTPLQSKTMLHAIPAQLVREWLTSVGFTSAAG